MMNIQNRRTFYLFLMLVACSDSRNEQKYPEYKQPEQRNINKAYFRVDTTPEKTEKLPFLDNYKNPCWRELAGSGNVTRIRCLPYYYTVGISKCGTTELYKRMRRHPLISSRPKKENQWLARARFWTGSSGYLSEYLDYYNTAVEKDITRKEKNGFFNSIFGDASTATACNHGTLLQKDKDTNMSQPHYTNANVIYNLYPKAKIIFMLRSPVERLYSEYLFQNKRANLSSDSSAEDFHYRVIRSVMKHRKCLKTYSSTYCVHFNKPMLPINKGFYHIYIQYFMNVFPREQILVIKLEDFITTVRRHMKDVFSFLDIDMPTHQEMLKINGPLKANNNNTRGYKKAGPMMKETYKLVHELYKPYNDQLVKLLGQQFDYN